MGTWSEIYGLVVRTTELERADGSKMKTVEFFSEEVAREVFRQTFESGDG